jgi:hypothetical protein
VKGIMASRPKYRRRELILALEGLRVEIAGLKNHVRQLSKDINASNRLEPSRREALNRTHAVDDAESD